MSLRTFSKITINKNSINFVCFSCSITLINSQIDIIEKQILQNALLYGAEIGTAFTGGGWNKL